MTVPIDIPVLIIGAGPVGVTMANLLGSYGVRTMVVDRSTEILDFPRAVGLDDEALRTFQAAGLAEDMLRDMIQNVPMRMYTSDKRCFAEILPTTREFGWCRRNLFSQPLGEATLRRGLARFDHVELRSGLELVDVTQDANGVTAELIDLQGEKCFVRCAYLVACDGGRSTVRQRLGLPYEGKTHPAKWVVIECDNDPLDAPYTALHCDPARPYVCIRLPYGLRRWEFMLFPGEDGDQMLAPEKIQALLSRHVANPERLNVIRARVYTHNSRVAKELVVGRICLAGDAAHITPPWIGQGLNAGLRDAFNLSWKLAWILQGRLDETRLGSYHTERHAHTKAMIELADLFGSVLSQRNRLVAWVRDRFFMSIRNIPRVRDYVLQMRFKPMPRFTEGVLHASGDPTRDELVGRMFIQPLVEIEPGKPRKLDDVLGPRFALISWRCDILRDAPPALREQLRRLGCDHYVAVRARSGPQEACVSASHLPSDVLLQDTENSLQPWFHARGMDWVLLRPDRFVAAVGRQSDGSGAIADFLKAMLPLDARSAPTAAATAPAALAS
jgi:3-(3-hydroxy-phenyl)propionate hydroxylase